jgi:hypothetical protein
MPLLLLRANIEKDSKPCNYFAAPSKAAAAEGAATDERVAKKVVRSFHVHSSFYYSSLFTAFDTTTQCSLA